MSIAPVTPAGSSRALLWLVALGVFMQMLDSTIVNTALPAMAASLGESPLRMQSVVIAYALTMAMLIPASGWLADRFGTRRVFLFAISLFALGSLLCALAHSLRFLVLARVVQGIGGSMLLPVGRLALMRSVPRAEFLEAMSFVAIPGLIGPLIGPTLGGWLVEALSWHWIFLINIPVGLVAAAGALRLMPDARSPVGAFDLAGYLMLAVCMVAISLALDGLSDLGLRHATVAVLFLFGMAMFVAYWLHATRVAGPLFPLALFRVPSYRIGVLGNLFARIGSSAMPFLIPLLLQVGLGFTPLAAGTAMIPIALAGMVSKRAVVPIVQRFGYRRVLIVNTVLVGVAMASFALIGPGQPLWLRIVQLSAFGLVNSLQFTAMNTVTLRDLEADLASSGNSLLSMVMMLAMSLGVALAGGALGAFSAAFGAVAGAAALPAFHATFIAVGLVTTMSAWMFWQLEPKRRFPVSAPVDPL
ncbi:MAG: multidrug transporter subunit MdtD [Dokdonella sp.]|uniref:multidrug transporter subunit MdtD n=1 Tax=Dokdonella sp. TaxID=2291710 RepID=UPI0027BAFDF2|nr:multidrug transporter subunit MdtD [Dokdonella sp.]MCW5579205.1 multidrug transporter subunit MdtD [Dokdonella sp.]